MRRFALHPGYITSKNDGDLHYIGAGQLARLYQLRPGEYFTWTRESEQLLAHRWDDYIHLYPDYHGRYGRPDVWE